MNGPGQRLRWARWVVRRLLGTRESQRLLDALDDEYVQFQRRERGKWGADLWYLFQIARSIPPLRAAGGAGTNSWRLDALHLLRGLRRNSASAFAVIGTLTCALGVGVSVLEVVDKTLLRPLPFPDPDRLFLVGPTPSDDPDALPRALAYADFQDWRDRARGVAQLAGYDPTNLTLAYGGAPLRLAGNNVTPAFLELLGAQVVMGRPLERDDLGQPHVVLDYRLWQEVFQGGSDVLGSRIDLGDEIHTVVGVLHPGFRFPLARADVWRLADPTAGDPDPMRVLARLRGGRPPEDLQSTLAGAPGVQPNERVRAPSLEAATAGSAPRTLALLSASAALAVLVAFMNLSILLLVRATDRRTELALRRALGAPPHETRRQVVFEALALTGAGIVCGLVVAAVLTPWISQWAGSATGRPDIAAGLGWRPVGIASVAALCLSVICAVGATLGAGRSRVSDLLRGRVEVSPVGHAVRRGLVAAQVSMALVMLVATSVLGASLYELLRIDPGFAPEGVWKFQVSLPGQSYPGASDRAEFHRQVLASLSQRPSTDQVAWIDEVPLTGDGGRSLVAAAPDDTGVEAVIRTASAAYWDVMGIGLHRGRTFATGEAETVPPPAVISRSLASRLFVDADPLGQAVWLAALNEWAEVIGVVDDVRHRSLDESELATLYLPSSAFPQASSILVVRTNLPATELGLHVREAVGRLDPRLPVYGVRAMTDVVRASPGVPQRMLLAATVLAFAIVALVLGALGLFGVAAHDVARRRPEMAIRVALGAGTRHVVLVVVASVARTVLVGTLAGAVLSVAAVRALAGFAGTGPVTEALILALPAAALLLAVLAIAVLPPVLTAVRSDPARALRAE